MATAKTKTSKTRTKKATRKAAPRKRKQAATDEPTIGTPKSYGLPKHVEQVLSLTKDGKRPKRVVIRCTDPQEEAECESTREIASQDVFQVVRCRACQTVHLKVRRRKSA